MSKLSKEALAAIEEHIKPKLNKKPCYICEAIAWVYPSAIYELREFGGGPVVLGTIVPVVVVTCQKCGNIVLFNAVHTAVVKP